MAEPTSVASSSRGVVLSNLFCFLATLWLGVRHVLLGVGATREPAAALLEIPSVPAYAVITLAALGSLVPPLQAFRQRASLDDRRYRIVPIVAVLTWSIHLLAMPSVFPLLPSDTAAAARLSVLEDDSPRDEQGFLETDPNALERHLTDGSEPPYLRDGVAMKRWNIVVQKACTAPVLELPVGVSVGTLIFCIAESRREGWVTAVGTGGKVVGPPALVNHQGRPAVAHLTAAPVTAANALATPGVLGPLPKQSSVPGLKGFELLPAPGEKPPEEELLENGGLDDDLPIDEER